MSLIWVISHTLYIMDSTEVTELGPNEVFENIPSILKKFHKMQ